jgi:hypothetical protein
MEPSDCFCLGNSEVHSASALLPGLHRLPPGSLEIALKRTRPRQRFCLYIGRDCMTEGGGCQGKIKNIEEYNFHSSTVERFRAWQLQFAFQEEPIDNKQTFSLSSHSSR